MPINELVMRAHEHVDMFMTSITRNKITRRELGDRTLVIHERKIGKWIKVFYPESEIPVRGKKRDIVYTIFDDTVERQRLGTMAKEQTINSSRRQLSPAT